MSSVRPLHPGAWWLWATGLATAASRTTNPILLALILVVAGYVVACRRTTAPWARAYGFYLRMGLVVVAIRRYGASERRSAARLSRSS